MNDIQKSKLETDCNSIRKNIEECGKAYLLVAYKIYELKFFETYKEKYQNISECCEAEFGFKKSTVYNMINIIEKFGKHENDGYITYGSVFNMKNFSYTQLSAMLSMTKKQIQQVNPSMTVSEIKKSKKLMKRNVMNAFMQNMTVCTKIMNHATHLKRMIMLNLNRKKIRLRFRKNSNRLEKRKKKILLMFYLNKLRL